jgi:hypothetical protein
MDDSNKFLKLLLLIMGSVIGFFLSIAVIILVLRLLSIALFTNRISEHIYHYFVVIVPYLIFFGAFYYLSKKVKQSKNKISKIIASLFLVIGCLICIVSFVCITAISFGIENNWLSLFDDNSGYSLVSQLLLVFLTAISLAAGDPKEKDWMDKP